MRGLFLAVLVIGVVLVGACAAPAAPEPKKTVTAVSAQELSLGYQRNQIVGDYNYKDKLLKVTGIVDSVGKDDTGTPYVMLVGDDKELAELVKIKAVLDAKYEPELAQLIKGQTVTVQGTGNSWIGSRDITKKEYVILITILLKGSVLVR